MDEKNIQEALHLLHDKHASVSHQCWIIASLEDPYSLEAKEEIQKALSTIQGDFLQFIFDRDDLFDIVEVFHVASSKDENGIYSLNVVFMSSEDSLRITPSSL